MLEKLTEFHGRKFIGRSGLTYTYLDVIDVKTISRFQKWAIVGSITQSLRLNQLSMVYLAISTNMNAVIICLMSKHF